MKVLNDIWNVEKINLYKKILKKILNIQNFIVIFTLLFFTNFHWFVNTFFIYLLLVWFLQKDDDVLLKNYILINSNLLSRNEYIEFLYQELSIIYNKYNKDINNYNIYILWGPSYASYSIDNNHYYILNKNTLILLYLNINNNLLDQQTYNNFIFALGHEVWHNINYDSKDIIWFHDFMIKNIIVYTLWILNIAIFNLYYNINSWTINLFILSIIIIIILQFINYYVFFIIMQLSELLADYMSVKIQIKDINNFAYDIILFFKQYEVQINHLNIVKFNYINNLLTNSIFFNKTHPHPKIRIQNIIKNIINKNL